MLYELDFVNSLNRSRLQALAKQHGIRANMTSAAIRERLLLIRSENEAEPSNESGSDTETKSVGSKRARDDEDDETKSETSSKRSKLSPKIEEGSASLPPTPFTGLPSSTILYPTPASPNSNTSNPEEDDPRAGDQAPTPSIAPSITETEPPKPESVQPDIKEPSVESSTRHEPVAGPSNLRRSLRKRPREDDEDGEMLELIRRRDQERIREEEARQRLMELAKNWPAEFKPLPEKVTPPDIVVLRAPQPPPAPPPLLTAPLAQPAPLPPPLAPLAQPAPLPQPQQPPIPSDRAQRAARRLVRQNAYNEEDFFPPPPSQISLDLPIFPREPRSLWLIDSTDSEWSGTDDEDEPRRPTLDQRLEIIRRAYLGFEELSQRRLEAIQDWRMTVYEAVNPGHSVQPDPNVDEAEQSRFEIEEARREIREGKRRDE